MRRLGLAFLALLFTVTAHAQVLGPGWWKAGSGGGGTVPSVTHYTFGGFGSCAGTCTATIPSTTAGDAYLFVIENFNNSITSSGYDIRVGGVSCGIDGADSGNLGSGGTGTVHFYCQNISGGQTSASVFTTSGDSIVFSMYEITGVPTSGPVEAGSGNFNSSGASVTCTSGTTTQSNELLVVSGGGSGGNNTWSSPTSPWVTPIFSGGDAYVWDQTGATPTTYSATVTEGGTPSNQACAIMAFRHS